MPKTQLEIHDEFKKHMDEIVKAHYKKQRRLELKVQAGLVFLIGASMWAFGCFQ
jgi:hypothetical protein